MPDIISFGEVLVDMLSSRIGQQDNGPESFTKFAGGAPANVAVAVARLGGRSRMAGKLGDDMFGHFLRDELHKAGVDTRYLLSTREANTALAFVSLDSNGERSFSFYRNPSADILFRADEFESHWFAQPGIFHICSNTLTTANIAAATMAGLAMARDHQWLISFDVNLRHNLWPTGSAETAPVWAALAYADVVKMSKEELQYMCGSNSEEATLQRLFDGPVQLLLVTDGGQPLRICSRDDHGYQESRLRPPAVTMVDSTGAGDAFIGGLLFQLAEQGIGRQQLADFCQQGERLQTALLFAAHCGGFAASRYGAFAAMPTRLDIETGV